MLHCDHVIDVINDAYAGHCGCMGRPILLHKLGHMGSHEWADMGLESQAGSAWITKLIVTIFSNV